MAQLVANELGLLKIVKVTLVISTIAYMVATLVRTVVR